jgi:hypothetical protein
MSNWPKVGDSLFAAGPSWETDALIENSFDWFISYAMSYKAAADAVVDSVDAKLVSADAVSYAVFFLYRHYVEVMLKGLINVGRMLEKRASSFPYSHGILGLWQECRPLLEATCPEGESKDTDAVEKCLQELHSLDPTGEAFRFGEQKDGNPTLPEIGIQMNLRNVRDVMGRIAGFLEGSFDWMHELLQHQADMDSESF